MKPLRHAARLLTLGVALSCLIAPMAGQASQPTRRHFITIDVPGVSNTVVTGLNNEGLVVGSYPSGDSTKSFVWFRGLFVKLSNPSNVVVTNANAINDWGQIVGLEVFNDFSQGGFFFDWGFHHFDNPNAVFGLTFPRGINNVGQIAGFFVDANSTTNGFVYQYGVFKTVQAPVTGTVTTVINGINDDGQTAGYYVTSQPDGSFLTKAFLSAKNKFTSLSVPGATAFTVATGLNNKGQVVGYYQGSDFATHGFVYEKGKYTTFDAPIAGNLGTYPAGINDDGKISGEYVDSLSQTHGFLLSDDDSDDDAICRAHGHYR